ncbi:hypothetical protein JW921_04480 [Candidatus Fermentibacterales bacterium]|nr:hypothetical protein [Candidatus Fermentibacterales bacterium]
MIKLMTALLPVLVPAALAASAETDYSGTWETTYGRLVLVQEGSDVHGWYSLQGLCTVEGSVQDDGRLVFEYTEPSASGSGWFALSEDGSGFEGQWREDGSATWYGWEGYRLDGSGSGFGKWLVVLEAEWQESMEEQDYSFGEMLTAWFERVPGVGVRHRFVHDTQDLARFCLEAAALDGGEIILLLASHGSTEGLELPGGVVDARDLLEAVEPLRDRLVLIHFSSCEVMSGGVPSTMMGRAGGGWREGFVLSGYDRAVDWHLSAIIEILYLDLVLEQGLSPSEAATAVLAGLDFAGSRSSRWFEPAGFTWLAAGGGTD